MKDKIDSKLAALIIISAAVSYYSSTASAHGYINSPASRSYLCNTGGNVNCGSIQYEPQSLEGLKGFPEDGPADGYIASAGKEQFHELDAQTTNRWRKVDVTTGNMNFEWTLTKTHPTQRWDYYITKSGWDQNKPLTRSDLDLTPFCHYDGSGQTPVSPVTQACVIPADRKGYNIILGVWSISDTPNAFYQAVDINVK